MYLCSDRVLQSSASRSLALWCTVFVLVCSSVNVGRISCVDFRLLRSSALHFHCVTMNCMHHLPDPELTTTAVKRAQHAHTHT